MEEGGFNASVSLEAGHHALPKASFKQTGSAGHSEHGRGRSRPGEAHSPVRDITLEVMNWIFWAGLAPPTISQFCALVNPA